MICIKDNQQGAEILMDYCAGRLDPARTADFGTHLQECAECRKLAEAQRAVWDTLEAWKPFEVSSDFDAKLYARLAQERTETTWLRWWIEGSRRIFRPAVPRPLWKPVASLAAVAAVLLLVVAVRMPYWADQVQSDTARQTQLNSERLSSDKIDADQVEQALEDMDILAPAGQASSKL